MTLEDAVPNGALKRSLGSPLQHDTHTNTHMRVIHVASSIGGRASHPAGENHVHHGPHLSEVVLVERARQADAHTRAQAEAKLVGLGLAVAKEVHLIHHDKPPLHAAGKAGQLWV